MSDFKRKKGTFFIKYFLIFSSLILVAFLILGIALMSFLASFLQTQTLNTLTESATSISEMTAHLVNSSMASKNPQGAAMTLYKTIETLSESGGSDVFICNQYGSVIVCRDMMSPEFEFSNSVLCEKHSSILITKSYIEKVRDGTFSEISTLGTVYEKAHAVAMSPILIGGSFVGFTVASAPVSGNIMTYLSRILTMFLFAASITLIIITIVLFILTDRLAKPIRQLETATRCYASGDFSYKVPELSSNDELAELIREFNAMAVSLSELENSRRSFVANVSHEFKTPMTTIGGFINGILDGTIPPEKQEHYLGIVASEVKRLSKMVNMMMNISKIESGNADLKIEQFDVSPKIVSTFLGFEQLISEKNIEVLGLDDLSPAVIHADSAMLDQVIYNIIDNAVKFTNNGGKIIANTADDKKYVYFSITNSGKGIPKTDINRIFERFYKVDKSRSTDVKSTGLGLYLVKSIVELLGGQITAESEPDNFTRFTVRMPK